MTTDDRDRLYRLSRLLSWRTAMQLSPYLAAMVAGMVVGCYAEPRSGQAWIALRFSVFSVAGLFGYLAWLAVAGGATVMGGAGQARGGRWGRVAGGRDRRGWAAAPLAAAAGILAITAAVIVPAAPLAAAMVGLAALLAAGGWEVGRVLNDRVDAVQDRIISTWCNDTSR
jgi:hypothetical protein